MKNFIVRLTAVSLFVFGCAVNTRPGLPADGIDDSGATGALDVSVADASPPPINTLDATVTPGADASIDVATSDVAASDSSASDGSTDRSVTMMCDASDVEDASDVTQSCVHEASTESSMP
jgi:hypothetical protein